MNKEDYLAAFTKIDLKGAFPNGSLNARNFRVQWVGRTGHEGCHPFLEDSAAVANALTITRVSKKTEKPNP